MDLTKLFDGYKTILAGLGLIGLALWQFSQGQYETALQSLALGLAALGLRHAIAKNGEGK